MRPRIGKTTPTVCFLIFLSCPRYINHKLKTFFNCATRCNKCKLSEKINKKTSKTPTNQKIQTYMALLQEYHACTIQVLTRKFTISLLAFCFLFCLKVMIFHTFPSLSYCEIQLGLTFYFSDKEECKWIFNGIFSDYARQFCSCILCRTDLSLALMWTIYYLISQNVRQFNLFHKMQEWCYCGFCWMDSTLIQKPSGNSSETRTTAYCISISMFISAG